jgi:hypothetical protein
MTFPTIDGTYGGVAGALSGGATGALGTSGNAVGALTGAATGALGTSGSATGTLSSNPFASDESAANSAVAELGNLISSLGSLSSQAQGLPLSAPTLPGLPQQSGYQPGVTDYMQFTSDND